MRIHLLWGGLLGWLLLLSWAAPAQSRHLRSQWQQLARQPAASPARAQLLWHLAWESELPAPRQDSVAAEARLLTRQLGDSLNSLTARVWTARGLVYAGQYQPAQAQLLAAQPAARRLADPWLRLQVLMLLARNQWGTATHPRAEGYLLQAWTLARQQPDRALRARVAWLLGTFYVDSGRALDWFFRSLPLAEQTGDEALQVNILGSIGYHHQALDDQAQAQTYYDRAVQLARQINSPPTLCRALVMSGRLHLARNELAQARRQYREAARYATVRNTQFTIATNLATTYLQAGAADSALLYARQSRQLAQSPYDLTLCYSALAQLFLLTNQLDSAQSYGRRAYAQRSGDTVQLAFRDLCQVLAQTYARQGNWPAAYAFQHRFQAYQDALTSAQVRTRAHLAQARYQLGQRQHRRQLEQRDQELAQLRRQRLLTLAVGAGLLLLAATGAGLTALRRRQRRRLGALRTRLAADLHDEVGALLLRVSLRAELLGDAAPPAGSGHLSALRADSQQALATLRDVVWSLDAGADTIGALLDRLREHLDQTAEPAGLRPVVTLEGVADDTPLAPPLRQHLYLLAKEAITNTVRHARQASEVGLHLRREGPTLHLSVVDDGQPAPAAPGSRGGLGLRSMQQRAATMGGQLTAGPRPDGRGWRVQLRVPLEGPRFQLKQVADRN